MKSTEIKHNVQDLIDNLSKEEFVFDFLIEDVISVELNAVINTEDVHLAQAINYLEAYNLEVGLLINLGTKSLEFKRLINSTFNQRNQKNQIKS